MTSTRARSAYAKALENLREFCEDNTDFNVAVLAGKYPVRFTFEPIKQMGMFDEENDEMENVDENGEIGGLTITVGLSTTVKSTMKFHVPAALLKKLIKLSEKAGALYYHSFREEADEADEEEGPAV